MFLGLIEEPESLVGVRDDAGSGVVRPFLGRSTTGLMPVKAELPGESEQQDKEYGCGTGVPYESDPGDAPVLGRFGLPMMEIMAL